MQAVRGRDALEADVERAAGSTRRRRRRRAAQAPPPGATLALHKGEDWGLSEAGSAESLQGAALRPLPLAPHAQDVLLQPLALKPSVPGPAAASPQAACLWALGDVLQALPDLSTATTSGAAHDVCWPSALRLRPAQLEVLLAPRALAQAQGGGGGFCYLQVVSGFARQGLSIREGTKLGWAMMAQAPATLHALRSNSRPARRPVRWTTTRCWPAP